MKENVETRGKVEMPVIKKGQYPVRYIEHMKGGQGRFEIEDILQTDEMHEKGRLFAIGTLEPGHSVGYHVHEEDMEICFFLEGEGLVQEQDGTEIKIGPGDTNIVDVGQGHMITNTGKTSLKYLAVIIYA